MRKIILAAFVAALMMLVPITSSVQTNNISKNLDISEEDENYELPSFYITEQENNILENFVENNFEGEDKTEAEKILDEVIKNDYEVDIYKLANNLSLYIYEQIPPQKLHDLFDGGNQNDLDNLLEQYWGVNEGGFIQNLFSQLLLKIIDMIKGRLGWTYTFFTEGTSVVYNGIDLFVNVVKDKIFAVALLFVIVVNDILAAPRAFIDSIKDLFGPNPDEYNNTISNFLDEFNTDIYNLIDEIESFVTNQTILDYIGQVETFISWIDEDPWKDPIHVYGEVNSLGSFPEDIIVTCRGQTFNVDSNKKFDFYVDPSPDSDSIPKKEFYGMHNCVITVSNEKGEIRSTIKLLSYCFSGGEISRDFIIRGKPKSISLIQSFLLVFENIMEKLGFNFPNIFLKNMAKPC